MPLSLSLGTLLGNQEYRPLHNWRSPTTGRYPQWFADYKQDKFYSKGFVTEPNAMTTELSTPVTVRDSDGNLKWSAHNSMPRSDDPADAAWTKDATTVSGNDLVETTALATRFRLKQNALTVGEISTIESEVKYGVRQWLILKDGANNGTAFDLLNGVVGTSFGNASGASITATSDGYYKILTSVTAGNAQIQHQASEIDAIDDTYDGTSGLVAFSFRSCATYRSDLGGMQDNPDTGDSYVPTTTAAVYARPVQYDTSGDREGMPIAPQRTNLLTDSNDFTLNWTGANEVITPGASTGTDGQSSMTRLNDDGSTGTGNVYLNYAVTVATSTQYVFAVDSKKDQLGWLFARLLNFTTPTNPNAKVWFDLDTGVVGTVGSEIDDSGIIDMGDGIYRCWFSFTTDATVTTGLIRLTVSDGDTVESVDLDGTSSIFIGNTDLQPGSYPSPYIPTNGSTVTRNAVEVKAPKAYVGTDAELTEGTWVMGVSDVSNDASGVSRHLSTSAFEYPLFSNSAQIKTTNGTTPLNGPAGVLEDGGSHKTVIAFSDGAGRSLTADGLAATTDANNYLDTNPPAEFYFLQTPSQILMPGGILEWAVYFPDRLSDAEIATITDAATAYPA